MPVAQAAATIAHSLNNYYLTISTLTPIVAADSYASSSAASLVHSTPMPTGLIIYAPIVLFLALFISLFGLNIISKIKNYKRIGVTLVLVLFAAGIPFVLKSIQNGVSFVSKAGPLEIPKSIEIKQISKDAVTVIWNTDASTTGAVRIFIQTDINPKYKVIISNEGKAAAYHQVQILQLNKRTLYGLEILSNQNWYNNNGNPIIIKLN